MSVYIFSVLPCKNAGKKNNRQMMDHTNGTKIHELGVVISDCSGEQPKWKAKRHNPKLKIYREFVLATLSALIDQHSADANLVVSACDALACSGIAGIQWKHHLHDKVHVIVADHDDVTKIKENAETNSLKCATYVLDPIRVPGDPLTPQADNEIHVCQADTRALMMMEAFQFMYFSAHKNCASYLEGAFHCISNGGVLCMTIADISTFARTSHVIKRNFGADIIKTEYFKESSARIVLAAMARAAAKCGKAIEPQYTISHDDFLLICVKIVRGHSKGDVCLTRINRLLHCRMCEERVFIENQLAPDENPYSALTCHCKAVNPGKTAVYLGPMWQGPLFDFSLLNHLHIKGKELNLSPKFFEILNLLCSECLCTLGDPTVSTMNLACEYGSRTVELNISSNGDLQSSKLDQREAEKSEAVVRTNRTDQDHFVSSQPKNSSEVGNGESGCSVPEDSKMTSQNSATAKRKTCEILESHGLKKARLESGGGETSSEKDVPPVNVPFYFNVNKFKRTSIPKLDKLVTILHSQGFHASRTHFDPCAIRTSATVKEFLCSLS